MAVDPQAQSRLREAGELFQRGEFGRAIGLCDRLLRQLGPRPDLLNIKGMSQLHMGHPESAWDTMGKAQRLEPDSPIVLLNRALIAEQMCDQEQARRLSREAARKAGNHPPMLFQAARIARASGDYQLALELVNRCLQMNPGLNEGWLLQATCYLDLGEKTLACQALTRAINLEPTTIKALTQLLKLQDDEAVNARLVTLIKQALEHPISPDDRISALFALAGERHSEKHYEQAFSLFRQANDEAATLRPFDQAAWVKGTEQDRAEFDEATVHGTAGKNLVFVTGMPRSGTSLVEQVLNANNEVMGCGETAAIGYLIERLGRQGTDITTSPGAPDPGLARKCFERYMAAMPMGHDKHSLLVDKSPMNARHIGFIARIFPGARFIFCFRHPLDIVLSCYSQDFQRGLNWSFDLGDIASVFQEMMTAMHFWQEQLPDRILPMYYENLVTDLPVQARRMANFLDLPWEDAMLQPHQSTSAVVTASNLQVREPVHTHSVERWRHYEPFLQEVAGDLEAAGALPYQPGD